MSAKGENRSSGLLLHITSLPGRFGVGDLGPTAHGFVARMAEAGQRQWQMLPIGPTGPGNSPYSSRSTFAGNPLLVSPEMLAQAGLLEQSELDAAAMPQDGRVDYPAVHHAKTGLLRSAATRFSRSAGREMRERYDEFRAREGPLWLDDYCLYAVLKESLGERPWNRWDRELAQRDSSTIARARRDLTSEIETQRVIQFLFFDEWRAFLRAARDRGVAIVGDLPLYVAHDSADVWVHRDQFLLDEAGEPTVVAGVPPDYFAATGQRWGNPIYDWAGMAGGDFSWWRARVRHALTLFDRLRIDHFRGIAGYWEIPASELTAVNGRWSPGPGEDLLRAIENGLCGELPIIAEDLGVITDDVVALRDAFGLPGMRVAQFGFDTVSDSSTHHPDNFPENVWAYTGTHDNDTTEGWFWEGNPRRRLWRLTRPRRSLYRETGGEVAWGLVEMVSRSRAMTSVFPMQDILGLGKEARMNTPGTTTGNWEWRLRGDQFTHGSPQRLRDLTAASGRLAPMVGGGGESLGGFSPKSSG